jgi:cysteine-rich repeat protein
MVRTERRVSKPCTRANRFAGGSEHNEPWRQDKTQGRSVSASLGLQTSLSGLTGFVATLALAACGGAGPAVSASTADAGDGQTPRDGQAAPACGFAPCQGDPTGTWSAASLCDTHNQALWALATASDRGGTLTLPIGAISACANDVVLTTSVTGTLRATPDSQYTAQFTVLRRADVTLSRGCADALFAEVLTQQQMPSRALTSEEFAKFCSATAVFDTGIALYQPSVVPGGYLKQCAVAGTSCRCVASQSNNYVDTGSLSSQEPSGTDGRGNPRAYCVQADKLLWYAPGILRSDSITFFDQGDSEAIGERLVTFERARDTTPSADAGAAPDAAQAAFCGNGRIDPGETCDDGNSRAGDGCNGLCLLEPNHECLTPGSPCTSSIRCGNGKLEVGEACDDGNTRDGDGCNADCRTIEPDWICAVPGSPCERGSASTCGNGIVESPEACDDGAFNSDDYGSCSPGCRMGPYCGDGVVQGPEKCDDGENQGRYGTCTRACQLGPYCGDGILQRPYEACDDGNNQAGDGCSPSCQTEPR